MSERKSIVKLLLLTFAVVVVALFKEHLPLHSKADLAIYWTCFIILSAYVLIEAHTLCFDLSRDYECTRLREGLEKCPKQCGRCISIDWMNAQNKNR